VEELCVPKSTMIKLLKEEVILREKFNSNQTGNQKRKRERKDPDVGDFFFYINFFILK
jgi:hypothetical protein